MSGSLSPGWLYLSEHYLGFYSYLLGIENKILVELKDIVEIAKERSKGNLINDSLKVRLSSGKTHTFTNVLRRDEVFELLQQLTNQALQRVMEANTETPAPGSHPAGILMHRCSMT